MSKLHSNLVISIILVLLSGVIHIFAAIYSIFPIENTLIFFIYMTVILILLDSAEKIILHEDILQEFRYISYLLISYLGIRTVRYVLVPPDHIVARYIWYSYYVILFLIGIGIYFAVLHIGLGEGEKVDPKWRLIYVPVVILSVLFLTNDFHQIVFRFPPDATAWTSKVAIHGPGFYAMLLFITLFSFTILGITIKKCLHKGNIKYLWTPLICLVAWLIYTLLYISPRDNWFFWFKTAFRSPEFNSIIVNTFIISLVYSRLIPSNRDYEKFWELSSLKMGISDYKGNIFSVGSRDYTIEKPLITKSYRNPLALDRNHYIESEKIQGGYSYWINDVSTINELKDELVTIGNLMTEENKLLEAENKVKKERAMIKEKMEIYDLIDHLLVDKVNFLDDLVNHLPEDEDEFIAQMKRASVTNVYIKRYSNLILLSQQSGRLSLMELRLALQESLDYLKLANISTGLSLVDRSEVRAEKLINLYALFQELVEKYYDAMASLKVDVGLDVQKVYMTLKIKGPGFEPVSSRQSHGFSIHKTWTGDELLIEIEEVHHDYHKS